MSGIDGSWKIFSFKTHMDEQNVSAAELNVQNELKLRTSKVMFTVRDIIVGCLQLV